MTRQMSGHRTETLPFACRVYRSTQMAPSSRTVEDCIRTGLMGLYIQGTGQLLFFTFKLKKNPASCAYVGGMLGGNLENEEWFVCKLGNSYTSLKYNHAKKIPLCGLCSLCTEMQRKTLNNALHIKSMTEICLCFPELSTAI